MIRLLKCFVAVVAAPLSSVTDTGIDSETGGSILPSSRLVATEIQHESVYSPSKAIYVIGHHYIFRQ